MSPRQSEALRLIAAGEIYPTFVYEDDGWYARWCGVGVDNDWVDEYVRGATVTPLSADAEDQSHLTLHDAWLAALKSHTGLVRWNDHECRVFAQELKRWHAPMVDDGSACKALHFKLESTGEDFRLCCNVPVNAAQYRALGEAVNIWGGLREMSGSNELAVQLDKLEAEDFMKRGANALTRAGYSVEGIDFSADIALGAEIEAGNHRGRGEERIKLVVKVAGQAVSANEVKFLLDQKSTLVFFRDRWIEVDRNILKQALRALEKGVDKKANVMAFAMGLGHVGALEIAELKAKGWVRGLVERMRRNHSGEGVGELQLAGFSGTLREYQRIGVKWLRFMTANGFGALLADDMGLGKTIQTIAWLLTDLKAHTPALIVTPLTLVSNWKHELKRFAPDLAANAVEVVNYHRLLREYHDFAMRHWQTLVIDEAQVIKNPKTQIARAVKALSPVNRIALTGTPIENTLEDVWAIEDFLNTGFLEDQKSFRARFAKPIADNPESAVGKRLRHALEPFILRRLKTESQIAAELGTKREIREYCSLSAAQRRKYEEALAAYRICEKSQGDVFALLTELKLVCDGDGKCERLFELLTSIFEAGESALVFSQYTKVASRLCAQLQERFGREFPYLHGALSLREREREIEKFNSSALPTAFVLSLKAGGFGLNLTRATHVIHFDRWWNPAVENQATDRAHRLGQSKDVFVHLMITEGTLEERIDAMLERKESLKHLLSDGQAFWQAVRLGEEVSS